MKKTFFLAAMASIMISQTGCFGSFTLVNKVYDFNDSASDNKFVKTLLFYVLTIIPVYEIAGLVDIIVLNLIEFWTGSNPIAMKAGEVEEQLMTIKGDTYKITATQNRFQFEKLENGVYQDMGNVAYSAEENSWSFQKDGLCQELIKFNSDETVDFTTQTGQKTYHINDIEYLVADNLASKPTLY